MTKAECKQLVRENLLDLMRALGVNQWFINIEYNDLGGADAEGFRAQMNCSMRPRYEKACITIDADSIEDEADFIRCLRHELIHVMLAAFNVFDDNVRNMMPPLDAMGIRTLDQFYHSQYEALVLSVEKMFDMSLRLTPKRLIAIARRRWGE